MQLEVSTWSIIKILLVLLSVWILWQVRDILALLLVVFILVAALKPSVEWLIERKIPRMAAVALLLLLIVGLFTLVLSLIIPAVIEQLQSFFGHQLPDIIDRVNPLYESVSQGQPLIVDIAGQLQQWSGNVLTGVVSFFGGLVSGLTILVLTFYLLLEEHPIRQAGLDLLPPRYRDQVSLSFDRITAKMGAWLRGQFLLSVIIGLVTALGMWLIGVPAPLAIGLLAGLLEILPIVGPLISGIVMVLLAATSPEGALLKVTLSIVFAGLVQFLEAQILVPSVMRQAIGLSPVIVILALLVGAQLGGITGAIIAVPLAAIIQVANEDWPKFKAARRT